VDLCARRFWQRRLPHHFHDLALRKPSTFAERLDYFASLLLVEQLGPRLCSRSPSLPKWCMGRRLASPTREGWPSFSSALKAYDQTIGVLRSALDRARVGDREKLDGLARLNKFSKAIENSLDPMADFDNALRHEQAISKSLGGRTAFDKPMKRTSRQLQLFSGERT